MKTLLEPVYRLAAADCAGRRVGTPGSRTAADWLEAQLTALGAVVSTHEFDVASVPELTATPVLVWGSAGLSHRRDFTEHLGSANLSTPRRAPLAGTADAWYDRWVPVPAVTPEVVSRARHEGAAGLLVPRGTDNAGWMPKLLAGPAPGPVPILAVRTDLHHRMATEGGEVTASVPLRRVAATGRNLQGSFGHEARVLLTAHYDGVGDDPGQRLPGAADNASGVAVVLDAARRLGPAAGFAVAFLDGEEVGALGAAHHARRLPPGSYVINIDGAGALGDAAAVEAGGPAMPLLTALDTAGRATGVPLAAGPMPSDNRRYAAAGHAAVGIGMGMPGYQTPAETPDRVDPDTVLAASRLVAATVRELIRTPSVRPTTGVRANPRPATGSRDTLTGVTDD